nr:retrotransposon protein, putative, Ty1-copia subclass [Tanacetum cinerariifolium]
MTDLGFILPLISIKGGGRRRLDTSFFQSNHSVKDGLFLQVVSRALVGKRLVSRIQGLSFCLVKVKLKKKAGSCFLVTHVRQGKRKRRRLLFTGRNGHTKFKGNQRKSKAKGDDGEGLYVRGRTDHGDSRYIKKDEQPSSSGSNYDDSEVMMNAMGGSVQLGDNRECKIRGIGKLGTLKKEGLTIKLQSGKVKVSLMLVLKKKTVLRRFGTKDWDISKRGDYRCWKPGAVWQEKSRKAHYSGSDRLCSFRLMRPVSGGIIGRMVKKLRTDNGLEFCNREFEQLCIRSRVARHLTVIGMPQQNGLVERMNKTLMDKTDQEDGDDRDAGDEETDQIPDLTDYQLARDRERRTRTKPLRFQDENNMAAYAFVAAEEEDTHEPKNKTWELVDHPARQKLVSCKWLFKIKEGIEGVEKPRYKARFDEYMLSNGFKHSSYDGCVYYRSYAPGEYIYLFLYVDDMLIACKSKVEIGSTKSLLKKEFDMKELEEAKKILDNRKSVKMSLGGHFKMSLKDFPVTDYGVERMSKVPYANAVRILMYLMVCTRPDIAYVVSVVRRYLANPDRGNYVDVTGFVDSDYAKDSDKGRSFTGYAFLVQGCVVSWKETLKHVVALSITEVEYMALTEAVNEAI